MEDNDGRNDKGECRESYNKYKRYFVAVVPGKVVDMGIVSNHKMKLVLFVYFWLYIFFPSDDALIIAFFSSFFECFLCRLPGFVKIAANSETLIMNGYHFSAKTALCTVKASSHECDFPPFIVRGITLDVYKRCIHWGCIFCLEEYIPIVLIQSCVLRLVPYIHLFAAGRSSFITLMKSVESMCL